MSILGQLRVPVYGLGDLPSLPHLTVDSRILSHLLLTRHVTKISRISSIQQNCCHQMSYFKAKIHQTRFQLGLCPRPRWGDHSALPDPLPGFKGSILLKSNTHRQRDNSTVELRQRCVLGISEGKGREDRGQKGSKGKEKRERGRREGRARNGGTGKREGINLPHSRLIILAALRKLPTWQH